jgi:hypothetical protein
LSFGFGFERSKAWAGCDGPWAVIFVLVGDFAMKMGYPVFASTQHLDLEQWLLERNLLNDVLKHQLHRAQQRMNHFTDKKRCEKEF